VAQNTDTSSRPLASSTPNKLNKQKADDAKAMNDRDKKPTPRTTRSRLITPESEIQVSPTPLTSTPLSIASRDENSSGVDHDASVLDVGHTKRQIQMEEALTATLIAELPRRRPRDTTPDEDEASPRRRRQRRKLGNKKLNDYESDFEAEGSDSGWGKGRSEVIKKFADIDKWHLDMEDITASSSSF